MKAWRAVGTMVVIAGLTSGCHMYSLEQLRHTTPQGSRFQTELSRLYMTFADNKEKAYDWSVSWHFADKGLTAAYGHDTAPENLSDWSLPKGMLPEMGDARERLMEALNERNEQAQPLESAKAQFYFDCWVVQQEERWQHDAIAYCRDNFNEAMDHLAPSATAEAPALPEKTTAHKKPAPVPSAKKPMHNEAYVAKPSEAEMAAEPVKSEAATPEPVKAAAPAKPASVDTTSYVVFFYPEQAALTPSGKMVVDEVVKTLEPQDNYEVVLNGHSDAVGTDRDAMKLSQERAEAVKQRLIDGGVKAGSIKVFAFGKSDLHVKTPDNTPEPANRRVEIFLNE